MSLYLYTHPLENSLFDVFDNDFFNTVTPKHYFGHPCRTHHTRRNHRRNPYPSLEKQLSKLFNEDDFKLVDFTPKINLSEDEKHYYIHADLPGLSKDQVKMELNDDHILTISGEREYNYNNNNNETSEKEKEDSKKEDSKKEENEMETEQTEQTEQENTQKENVNEAEKDNRTFSFNECSYGSFSRSFSIPEDADLENIQAKMENGVLEIVFNKIEPPKPQKRTIQIQ